jgi:DNA-binding NarL/FixJ family response regulator
MREKVLLIDAHGATRHGLSLLLMRAEFSVVGSTGDARRGVALAAARRPHVIVLDPDIDLLDEPEAEWLTRLRVAAPGVRILLHTSEHQLIALREHLTARVEGLVLTTCSVDQFVGAIRAVAKGHEYVDPRAVGLVRDTPGDDLSTREREVLALLAVGLTGELAATALFLSPETVRTHLRNAMRKLGAPTRVRAVVVALEAGLITAEPHEPAGQERSRRFQRSRPDLPLRDPGRS